MERVTKDPDVRYQEFIDIAIRLFSKRGFDGVTVRDILEEVQGTQGMFYHYFKSKQDLYDQALRYLKNRVMEDRYEILVDGKRSFREKIQRVETMIALDISRYQGVISKNRDQVFNLEVKEGLVNRLSDGFEVALRQALTSGEIKENEMIFPENLPFFSSFFISGINGALLRDELTSGEDTEDLLGKILRVLSAFVTFND